MSFLLLYNKSPQTQGLQNTTHLLVHSSVGQKSWGALLGFLLRNPQGQ